MGRVSNFRNNVAFAQVRGGSAKVKLDEQTKLHEIAG